ncbi:MULTISPECIES: hypothetical protein [unclassified Haloferax]|uniref:hypothetical protein n=1 Tax=unclassified Haloferax TaxID=2625095 RepID=UPI002876C318|nr:MULTISPECIES: hypothetical protein [unclassified Haloferax]MDS0243953.1 hypothetical protein [Haloferax sp. S2CR25]MDS0447074.1 hypothetical protein [Haloferax sp. S2CR25-2]
MTREEAVSGRTTPRVDAVKTPVRGRDFITPAGDTKNSAEATQSSKPREESPGATHTMSNDDATDKISDEADLNHGDAPRELVINAGETPVARLQMVDEKTYDGAIARSLRAFADALENESDDALDADEFEYVIEEDLP